METRIDYIMRWYHYIACFFAGGFLANCVPHFIQGVSGASFPTPFADPPGIGLSSSYVNVLWAFVNLLAAILLWKVGRMTLENKRALWLAFFAFFIMSLMLSHGFKHLYN
jgi:hypothetical protein